jgi:chemotaxis protein MotB
MNLNTKLLLLAAVLPVMAAGCVVPNEKYRALRIENEGLRAQLGEAQADVLAAKSQSEALSGQLDRDGRFGQNATQLISNKDQQIDALRRENSDLQSALDAALTGQSAPLPPTVVNELNRFASQNPDLVTFDAERGSVRFTSDLTFDSGSAVVKPGADSAITRFADILNGPSASDYELMVAGHTDNVPVGNERTRRLHPNNWYLSSHRAISVAEALMGAGVGKNRLAAVGYADQRPVADNATTGGRAQNRRVEVLILPTRAPGEVAPGQNTGTRTTITPAATTGNDVIDSVDPLPMDDPRNK